MLAETIPTDWMASPKFLPSAPGISNNNTSMGKPTVPPPIGVDPATYDPKLIARAIGQCASTSSQLSPRTRSAIQIE